MSQKSTAYIYCNFIEMRGWRRISVIHDSNSVNKLFAKLVLDELESRGIEVANNPDLRGYDSFELEENRDNIMPLIEEVRRVKTRVVFLMTLT
jgi:hypothetical protein